MSRSGNDEHEDRDARTSGLDGITPDNAWKLIAVASTSLVLALLFLDVLQLLIRPLGVLLAAIVVAITLAPIVDWLERWVPRLAAVLVVYLGLVLILIGFGAVLIPPVVSQASLLLDDAPGHYRDLQVWLADEFGVDLENDADQLATIAEPAAEYLLGLPSFVLATGIEFLVGFFVSLYWLHSMPRIKSFAISLFPPARQERVDAVMGRVGQRMGGYMRGVVLAGTVVGAAVYIGLTILGIEYALLLALVAFLGEFFPNVGPVLAGIPAVIIALYDSPSMALIVILFYVVIQQIESYILMPFIMMRSLAHIPPLVTTFAVFTGFLVGGVLWAILAIPISGAILTISTDVVAPAIRRKSGAMEPDAEQQDEPSPATAVVDTARGTRRRRTRHSPEQGRSS